MLKSDLVDMIWSNNGNWERLGEVGTVTEKEIDNYVEILFREVAEKLEVKFDDIKDILYGRNKRFFEKKTRLFYDETTIYSNNSEFQEIQDLLMLPCISYSGINSDVDRFLGDFRSLSLKQKVELINKMSTFKVDRACVKTKEMINDENVNCDNVTNIVYRFNELTEVEKTKVLEILLNLNVRIDEKD